MRIVLALSFVLHSSVAAAADAYVACRNAITPCPTSGFSGGNPVVVNEWCTCKSIASTCTQDVFIPTKSRGEWAAFMANPPGCTVVSNCTDAENSFAKTSAKGDVSPVSVPTNCSFVQIIAKGGGGGGGNTNNGGPARVGGNGGHAETAIVAVNGPYTFTVGLGGIEGQCNVAAVSLGGAGGFSGGASSFAPGVNGGNGEAGSCTGGAAGSDVGANNLSAGAGGCGGGGGGGDNNTTASNELRKGGGGGGATRVRNGGGTDVLIAGGGGGGGGANANIAGQGGNACANPTTGAGLSGGTHTGANNGPGGGGGGCFGGVAGTYASTGGAGGAPTAAAASTCTGASDGGDGSVFFYFSY